MSPSMEPDRFLGLDKLRGLLISNMAVGHAVAITLGTTSTEFWFRSESAYTDVSAFFVRYINHSATPFFFLVMGISMALLFRGREISGWRPWQQMSFFLSRGLLLIALTQPLDPGRSGVESVPVSFC